MSFNPSAIDHFSVFDESGQSVEHFHLGVFVEFIIVVDLQQLTD